VRFRSMTASGTPRWSPWSVSVAECPSRYGVRAYRRVGHAGRGLTADLGSRLERESASRVDCADLHRRKALSRKGVRREVGTIARSAQSALCQRRHNAEYGCLGSYDLDGSIVWLCATSTRFARRRRGDRGGETAGLNAWFLSADVRGNASTRLDSRHSDGEAWTSGNLVRLLVHGAVYFVELLGAVRAMRPGDQLFFTDWRGDSDERLDGPGTEVSRVLVTG